MHELRLRVYNDEYIVITFSHGLNQCHPITIYFVSKNQNILLLDNYIYSSIDDTIAFLKKIAGMALILSHEIDEDIGYMWNTILHSYTITLHTQKERWIGLKYCLWHSPGNVKPTVATWMYNSNRQEIVLKITPIYFWHFVDPQPDETFISYQDFIKQYKPYVVRTLSVDTVQQWIKQLKAVSKKIKKSTERYDALHRHKVHEE